MEIDMMSYISGWIVGVVSLLLGMFLEHYL